MRKTIFNRSTIIGGYAALIIFTLAAYSNGQDSRSGNVKTSLRPVRVIGAGTTVSPAGSSLSRNNDGIFFTLHSSGLPPGHAVTAWLAVFNNPENCATRPCTPADFANPDVNGTLLNTGGQIIGLDGTATYGAFRAVGDVTGARPGVGTGNGLVDPGSAEIHIVLRSHGPAVLGDPTVLGQQLSIFGGGCTAMNMCMNLQTSIHQR